MNKLIALLVLSSCATAIPSYPPDSSDSDGRLEHEFDAAPLFDAESLPDAAPPQIKGCDTMGLLPKARTVTINPGDSIPGSIINELEDMIIGGKKNSFTRRYYPKFVVQGGWAAGALVTAGIIFPGYTSTGVTPAYVEIPYEVGDHLIAMTFQACGNGVVDLQVDLNLFGSYGAGSLSLGNLTDTNRAGGAWSTATVAVDTARPAMVEGGLAQMVLTASAAGYTIAQVSATFERL